VLLFAHVGVLGVAWLRIASAAAVFAVWRRPWRMFAGLTRTQRRVLIALGVVLGAMNACFYIAISLLPLAFAEAVLQANEVCGLWSSPGCRYCCLRLSAASYWHLSHLLL